MADTLPTGESVVAGQVNVARPGANHMTVTQGSDSAVVNWNSFSIGSGARVDFRQPSAQSRILNRVTGDTTTAIHGQMTANGQVHVVNPNGIFIGPDGVVNTGGFVASTLDIGTEDFQAGRYNYSGSGNSAGVTNKGRIVIGRGGYAALLGGRVNNSGTVTVPLGRIGFASGERVTLDVSGDQFMQVTMPTGSEDMEALIQNSGTASADGGLIEMRAATARHAARHAINLSGVAEARSVSVRNGTIILGGGAGGTVTVSGTATTSTRDGDTASQTAEAPRVELTGQKIALIGARISASAEGGGGLIQIGGDFGGEGYLQHAETVTADADTHIVADALDTGDGGRIVVWSDERTTFAGSLSAQGGDDWGDGGFIEVSSKQTLAYSGLADTRAANGAWGMLLLDPEDITIDPGAGGETTLESNLSSGNVTLNTFNNGLSEAGNITINADIDWSAATTLSLVADNSITLNGAINGANGTFVLDASNQILPTAQGSVNVDTFRLNSGRWQQIGAPAAFSARDFRISSGTDFLRVTGGDGSVGSPYQIADVFGLQGLASSSYSGSAFALANNIDASGTANWTLANGNGFLTVSYFDGVFDGQGFTVSGLFIDGEGDGLNDAAMFDTLDADATVSDLTITGANVNGAGAAVLAVSNDGTIRNVRVSGTVASTGYFTGGLVAYNAGLIEDSIADVTINTTIDVNDSTNSIGGFVGANDGTINRSHALGNVTVTNSVAGNIINAGGFVGEEGSGLTINNSYARGDVSVDAGVATAAVVYGGGFAGSISGSVNTSYSTGSVSTSGGATFNTGGFAGQDFGGNSGNFFDTTTSGFSTSAAATGISTAQFQDTETFFSLGSGAGWDFAQVWAPGDTGFYPVNYTTNPVVLATPNALTVQYGLTPSATATGSIAGGPSPYVFDDDADTLDTSSVFTTLSFSGQDVGAQTFTVDSSNLSSSLGVTYRVVDRVGSATVTAAPLTITPDDVTKTYGQAVTLTDFTLTAGTLYFSDTIDTLTLASAGAPATATVSGSPYTITSSAATGTGLSNYTITYGTGTLTVNPAPLTITADDAVKTFGETFTPTEFTVTGLLNSDSVDDVFLYSDGSPASATVADSPYAITFSGVSGTGLDNYDVTTVDGSLVVTSGAENETPPPPPPVVDNGLPNPGDTIVIDTGESGESGGSAGTGSGGDVEAARETLEATQTIAGNLEAATGACAEGGEGIGAFLACLSSALDDFSSELDGISTDLPPGMENVAQIVQTARADIDRARVRAAQRLAGAQTDAERRAITDEAVAEARTALNTASNEIRKAISLVRAEDPELAAVQRATVTTVASAIDTAGIQLSRVVEL
ncbi:filamentous hemagglutinin N-terminal domain-containing protein [Pseudooceanicola sp.]|uniref:two-partner secretion domain-containing protein n=1 Tax=Pseudooceanicola sp. TaxID=1914328 RepID=UPI0035C6A98E